jgi:hypothetical protein
MKVNTILLVIIIFATSSCTITNKLFHKSKTVVDSTYSHKEKSDSLTKVDSSTFHKENTTTITKADSSKTNEQTTINEHTVIKEFNDSGKVKKETVIDKKTEIKKGEEKGSLTVFENAGKIDSNNLKKEAKVSKQNSDSGHVTKKEKEVTKEVHKKKAFTWMWWLLLLIPAYLIYRNWPKIKSIVIHLITGL